MAFSACLSWHLGSLAKTTPQAIGMIGWFFCAVQVAGIVTGWIYFSYVQALFAAAVSLCLGLAAAFVPSASRPA
jgi:hypothetical protein